ncbi:MAG: cadmium-translocating P-type ATPase [Erythrobacter sp.]|uniref:heavy metal translocating P-type ATPase n=1 Tax=Erythrobacter sp. TaxID=1042 RepID=UPI0025F9EC21|nr:heavy metal translocating P-type ATPase [Erythrobacter sp.]MCL9998092.1 cadmium-translocating P-type ATPase [Erythrobacter sp.]
MNAPVLNLAAESPLVTTRLTVPGMKCAGCIGKIERELAKTPGIAAARANLSAKRVAISHDPALDEGALAAALLALGFESQPVTDNPLASDDADHQRLTRALGVAGFGMMNIMLLSVSVWSGAEGATRGLFHWLSAAIALPVVAYAGRPFFASAWMALKHRRTNMDVPISIGVILATCMSLYETITGGAHAFFDSAVMLLFFLLAGRALDAEMRTRTRAGIGALLGRMGKSASVIGPDGATRRVAAKDLAPGMLVLVAAGEALAADGEVVEGRAALDNSMLTGESAPEPVAPGSLVHAGAINMGAPLKMRLTHVAEDTALAEIARAMDEAGQSRSTYVRIADRASRLYAPVVHTLALMAFAGWLAAGAGWHASLTIAIAVLIITCPCAMGLAVPAAQVVASGALMRRGLLVKDGSALERLAECDLAVLDKTGTLTLGTPRADIASLDPQARSIALALAQTSRHPLSRGLAAACLREGVIPAVVEDIREAGGSGLAGRWQGLGVALEKPEDASDTLATTLRIGETRQVIAFADPLRPDAAAAIAALAAEGLPARILSGDRAAPVAAIAAALGLPAQGGADPRAKLAALEALKADGHRPLMVGDGLNDGPALAAAHASIAPGTASDASQQAADAVFIGEALMPVALAVRVAKACMRIVRQNFGFSIAYNALAVPLALTGQVTPLVAAIAMSVSSLVVIANSLRLAGAAPGAPK